MKELYLLCLYTSYKVNSTAAAGTGGAAMKAIINTEVAGKVSYN